jgi:hypothetical protein
MWLCVSHVLMADCHCKKCWLIAASPNCWALYDCHVLVRLGTLLRLRLTLELKVETQ